MFTERNINVYDIYHSLRLTELLATLSPVKVHLTILPWATACNLTIPSIACRVATACLLTRCPWISACNLIIPFRARKALHACTKYMQQLSSHKVGNSFAAKSELRDVKALWICQLTFIGSVKQLLLNESQAIHPKESIHFLHFD